MTRTFAWIVVRLGFLLVPAWIAAAFASAHYLPGIDENASAPAGALVPKGSDAVATQAREARAFDSTVLTRVVVVQHAERGLRDDQLRRTIRLAVSVDRDDKRRPLAFAAPLVSGDKTTTVTYLYYPRSVPEAEQLESAQRYARALDPPGLRGGPLLARNSEFDQIEAALPKVTIATVALILLVLVLSFRALLAPLVGLAAAGIAYVISVHVLAWLGEAQGRAVPKEVEPILVALLLGLVTDYALFFMATARRHLAEGASRIEAAQRATEENVPIVLTAGLIVALGSLTLMAGQLAVFRSFGPGMAVTVLVAIAVSLTFIPAVLAALGPLIFWPSLQRPDRQPRQWLWRTLTARPVAALVVAATVAGLVVVSSVALQARLGFTLVRGLPAQSESKKAQTLAEQGFARGILAPTEILIQGQRLDSRRDALARFQAGLRGVDGVALVVGPAHQRIELPVFVSRDGSAARYAVVLREEALDARAIDILERIQQRVPGLVESSGLQGVRVSYAGDTVLAQDTVRAIRADGFRVGATVLLVNLVLLALFLRALWPPLYLLAASVLALAAALGATTFVMQGLLHHDDITYYVPFAAAVLLLSLGSDYNVFVVGRIWQSARSLPMREAIATAAPRASSTITTAGLTLAGSFALLALVPVRPMRELALAMAAGILLDTFVVRSVLVPALLALFRSRERASSTETEGSADLDAPLHE